MPLLIVDAFYAQLVLDGIVEQLEGVNLDEIVWLEEIQPPENFVVFRGQYKGPLVKKP